MLPNIYTTQHTTIDSHPVAKFRQHWDEMHSLSTGTRLAARLHIQIASPQSSRGPGRYSPSDAAQEQLHRQSNVSDRVHMRGILVSLLQIWNLRISGMLLEVAESLVRGRRSSGSQSHPGAEGFRR